MIFENQLSFGLEIDAETRRLRSLDPKRLPTNTTTANHPIHRWFNFIAGFSPEFVDNVCDEAREHRSHSLLLDPFAGCGTALVQATQRGISSVGYEAHPFFERICRAKLDTCDAHRQLDEIERILCEGFDNPLSVDSLRDGPRLFLQKLFPLPALAQLLGARESLIRYELTRSDLAFLVLAKTVERSSHSATDGIYKAPSTKQRSLLPRDALRAVLTIIHSDLAATANNLRGTATVFGKSSEKMSELAAESVSVIVTSPPYLNNFDYAEMTRMQLYFWGIASSWAEITDRIRSRLIVNTTTALKGHKEKQNAYRAELPRPVRNELDVIVSELGARRVSRPGHKDYDMLVYPYFAQIARVFGECLRVMKKGASMHIMIADSALYGVHIQSPQILTRILVAIGFRECRCTLVRKRGHRWILKKREGSKKGLGEYHIRAIR